MNRDELDELMLLYASGAADASERAAVEAKLSSGDAEAQQAFSEAMVVLAQLPRALDPIAPPKRLRDQLLFRVAANVQQERGMSHGGFPWSTRLAAGIAAVLAVALTVTLLDRQQLVNQVAEMSTQSRNVRQILESPYVSLAKMDSQSNVPCSGRVLYCPIRKEYEVVVFNLAPPGPGKVYELWLITPTKKVMPAGTFTVDIHGSGIVNFKAPKDEVFSLAAITDEPEGGSAIPTGSKHLVGSLLVQ